MEWFASKYDISTHKVDLLGFHKGVTQAEGLSAAWRKTSDFVDEANVFLAQPGTAAKGINATIVKSTTSMPDNAEPDPYAIQGWSCKVGYVKEDNQTFQVLNVDGRVDRYKYREVMQIALHPPRTAPRQVLRRPSPC